MGLFLRITYQSQGGRTPETAFKNQKILDEIIDGGDKDNIIALIGLAKINDSILEEDARIFINNIDKYLLLK